ncbi:hypothetical protein Slin14017_G104610 [Septoria linicola]|nr:hypothetical protein Slin14017_G104610 [Septoria linicola]
MTEPLRRSSRNKVASPKARDSTSRPASPSSSPKSSKVTKTTKTTPTRRKMSSHRRSLSEALDDQAARADFAEMGVPANKMETFMATSEPEVDMLGYPTRFKEEKEARIDAKEAYEKRLNSPSRKKKNIHQICPSSENKNWVLFNPSLGFPPTFQAPGPDSPLQRYANYEPGNEKIVLFNVVSGAIGLRSTPESMEGMVVEYTKAGVKIVTKKKA